MCITDSKKQVVCLFVDHSDQSLHLESGLVRQRMGSGPEKRTAVAPARGLPEARAGEDDAAAAAPGLWLYRQDSCWAAMRWCWRKSLFEEGQI